MQTEWSRCLVAALNAAGVRDLVISPGSRSTPLVCAAANTALRLHNVIDERSAAFFALGQARLTGRPSALLCTSGTAAAHYFPAVIEAQTAGVPMIVLTADRPPELAACRAPQTIDQLKLFGDHVRRFFDLGAPTARPTALAGLMRIAAQAVLESTWPKPGAVHLNARLHKPLEPDSPRTPEEQALHDRVSTLIERGPPEIPRPTVVADASAVERFAQRCNAANHGLIVCGPAPARSGEEAAAILGFSRDFGFGILAESTSQLRFGGDPSRCISLAQLEEGPGFDLIVRLGDPLTSTGWRNFVADHPDIPRVVVDPFGCADPSNSAQMIIVSELLPLLERVRQHAPKVSPPWKFGQYPRLRSGPITQVVENVQKDSVLVLGNSLTVRQADEQSPPGTKRLRVLSQRGAAGIDGLISGAAGAASVTEHRTCVVLGDLSALHDLGGLYAARGAELTIVVINNRGGRIFERLPAFGHPGVPIDQLRTPHELDFEHAAEMFGLTYVRARTAHGLQEALRSATGTVLIEAEVGADGQLVQEANA